MIIECTKGKMHDKKDEKGFIWGAHEDSEMDMAAQGES